MKRCIVVLLLWLIALFISFGALAQDDIAGMWAGTYSGDIVYEGTSIHADNDVVELRLFANGDFKLSVLVGSFLQQFEGTYTAGGGQLVVNMQGRKASFSYGLEGEGDKRVLSMNIAEMKLGNNSVKNFTAKLNYYGPNPTDPTPPPTDPPPPPKVDPPVISTTELPGGERYVRYTQSIAYTGTKPISWSVSGNLPDGLDFYASNENGKEIEPMITGVPTEVGEYTFTITASNSGGKDSKTYTVNITQLARIVTNSDLGSVIVGQELPIIAVGMNGSETSFSLIGGDLPPGTHFLQGIEYYSLYGTPTATGTYQFTIKGTCEYGEAEKTFKIVVIEAKDAVDVKSISFVSDTANVEIGKSIQPGIIVNPASAKRSDLNWSSQDHDIADVDGNGNVTGHRSGRTGIRVQSLKNPSIYDIITVDVINDPTIKEPLKLPDSFVVSTGAIDFAPSYGEARGAKRDLSNMAYIFTSSNPSVAFVNDKGQLVAKKTGETTITGTLGGGAKAAVVGDSFTVKVTVVKKSQAVNKITLSEKSITLDKGASKVLTPAIKPATAIDKTVTWFTSDPAVAIVSGGKVTGVGAGSATITAMASSGKVATCGVTVTKNEAGQVVVAPTGMKLEAESRSVVAGEITSLDIIYTPQGARTPEFVSWSSSNESVASVHPLTGDITALAPGKATITATLGKLTASCVVTVKDDEVRDDEPVLRVGRLIMQKGKTAKLKDLTSYAGKWESSNPAVAFINAKGALKAKSIGAAKLTFTIGQKSMLPGDAINLDVEVVNKGAAVTKVKLSGTKKISAGQTTQLKANIKPKTAKDTSVFWASDNPNIAIVDQAGLVTAVAKGKANILCVSSSGVTGTIKITVK